MSLFRNETDVNDFIIRVRITAATSSTLPVLQRAFGFCLRNRVRERGRLSVR